MAIALKYWNGRGLMEVPRMMLALSGKFPGDYIDGRYNAPPPTTDLDANLGRMPVASIGDENIGQSGAINFYFAQELGFLGKSNVEAAQILSIAEHVKEMHNAYKSIAGTREPSAETLDKWFDGGAKDLTGAADRAGQPTRYLTWWLGRMEHVVGKHGPHAIGKSLSLADVLFFGSFVDHLSDEQSIKGLPQFRKEPFGSKLRTEALLAKHPKIAASANLVAAHPNIQKWVKIRGVQMF